MKVSFDKSFHKRLVKVKDRYVLEKVKQVILQVEEAGEVQSISNIKKIEGFRTYYRIRVGYFRIGVELKDDVVCFITIANRKDIYKNFP